MAVGGTLLAVLVASTPFRLIFPNVGCFGHGRFGHGHFSLGHSGQAISRADVSDKSKFFIHFR